MAQQELFPIGVRRDGSYYTRICWASVTEADPRLWVLNLIDDDLARDGGTYGANTESSADVIFDFFGETQTVQKIRFYKNVGVAISVIEELARHIHVYSCTDDTPAAIRTAEDDVSHANWIHRGTLETIKQEGWQELQFEEPFCAKYIRFQLDDNFCPRDESFIPWAECNEIKIYGSSEL